MTNETEIFQALRRHGVPFVIIGAHAVSFHGYGRATEDADVVWLRSAESEGLLLKALTEIQAHYIGNEVDPVTGLERTYPVSLSFIKISPLMMLTTRFGFLDLFDFIPGLAEAIVGDLFATSIEVAGVRYASLPWLRQMKEASGRPKDKIDLDNLPK